MRRLAFTLIEMLIVVAIVSVLALISSAYSASSINRAYFTQLVSIVFPLSKTARISTFKTGACLVQGIRASTALDKIESYKHTTDGTNCYLWVRLSLVNGPEEMRGKVIRLGYSLSDASPLPCETNVNSDNYHEDFCHYNAGLGALY